MKLNTVMRPNFTGEYWTFTVEQDLGGNNIQTFSFIKNLSLNIQASTVSANGMTLYSPTPLQYQSQLRNVQDMNGNYLYSNDGTTWQPATIGVAQTVLNAFGTVEGYRYELSKGYSQ